MRRPSWDLNKAMEQFKFQPKELSKNAIYEVGKTYWCNYWSQWYKVLDTTYENLGYPQLKSVTVQWQDGKIGTHCTNLDLQRDWELVWQ